MKVIQDPPWGSHNHRGVGAETVELAPNRVAADHREDLDLPALSQLLELGRHLRCKLPGGAEDERLNVVGIGVKALQDGHRESCGLARARLRLSDQISACERNRQCQRLDGCGVGVANLIEGSQHRRREPKLGEADGGGGIRLGHLIGSPVNGAMGRPEGTSRANWQRIQYTPYL